MTTNTIRNFEIWVETKKNASRREKKNASRNKLLFEMLGRALE